MSELDERLRKIEEESDLVFPKEFPCYTGVFLSGASRGSRNETAMKLASFLKGKGMKTNTIKDYLTEWNERNYSFINEVKKQDKLLDEEIASAVKNADKKCLYTCKKLKEIECFSKHCDESICKLKPKKSGKWEKTFKFTDGHTITLNSETHHWNIFHEYEEGKEGKEDFILYKNFLIKNLLENKYHKEKYIGTCVINLLFLPQNPEKKVLIAVRKSKIWSKKGQTETLYLDPYKISQVVMKVFRFITLKENNDTRWYDDGYYRSGGDEIIESFCSLLLGHRPHDIIKKVIEFIKQDTGVMIESLERKYVAFQNVLLNTRTMRPEEFSESKIVLYKVPIFYNPKKKWNFTKIFFEDTFLKEDVDLALQYLASGIMPWKTNTQIIIGHGVPDTAKSKFGELAATFVGIENATYTNLKRLRDEPYEVAQLEDKLLCICDDVDEDEIGNSNLLKRLTGGLYMTVRDIYKKPKLIKPLCKFYLNCNDLPEIYEDTEGLWKRLRFISFEKPVPLEKQDEHIVEKICTPDELSGLLNEVLRAGRILIEEKRYIGTQSFSKTKKRFSKVKYPVRHFIEEHINQEFWNESNLFLPKKEGYGEFFKWCMANKIPPPAKSFFYEKFQHETNAPLRHRTMEIDGEKKKREVWLGVEYVDEKEDIIGDDSFGEGAGDLDVML